MSTPSATILQKSTEDRGEQVNFSETCIRSVRLLTQ